MSDTILATVITCLVTLVGIFVSAKSTRDKVTTELKVSNEVQNTKIEHLTEEVRKHNNFAQRIPVIEGELKLVNEKISVANHRIDDLEAKTNNLPLNK